MLPFWAKVGASKKILGWLAHGVDIPFSREPPAYHHRNPQWDPAHLAYWKETLLPKLLAEAAIVPVDTPSNWVASTRLESKKSGGYRHLVDLRPLNAHIALPKTKYETLGLLPHLAR